MNNRSLLVLSLAGSLALGASWVIGYGMGKRAYLAGKDAELKAQVDAKEPNWNC